MSLSAGRVGVRADQVDSHGRVISPSFLNEIMEDLPEWTDLPVRVNGTEELIPSNPSVPVTSPILADIDYPDVRRNNQYFTYRESPTSVDGLAKIKSIKGNTLVWNQLIRNGNFVNTSFWATYAYRFDFSVASNKGTFTTNGSDPQIRIPIAFVNGHKYLFTMKMENVSNVVSTYIRAFTDFSSSQILLPAGTSVGELSTIFTANADRNILDIRGYRTGNTILQTGDAFSLSNVMLIDLTKMGLDITDPSEFTSLFSLPYYDYNEGSLLSFNGTGIKTTNADRTEESTTSLPTSTYFPTGMKSAGSVYDELTPTKAITRIGVVDLGSLTWTYASNYKIFICDSFTGAKGTAQQTQVPNMKNAIYRIGSWSEISTDETKDMALCCLASASQLRIRNLAYTDASTFKSAMSGVYLYYELATPVELPTLSFE